MDKYTDTKNKAKTNGLPLVQSFIDEEQEKEVIWFPHNLKDEIRNSWPLRMRREIGFQLGRVQQGFNPDHFREMPIIGAGVREIKIQDENKTQYRLIYLAKFPEGIYAFYAIARKTTQKTSALDLSIAKIRYQQILKVRRNRKYKNE